MSRIYLEYPDCDTSGPHIAAGLRLHEDPDEEEEEEDDEDVNNEDEDEEEDDEDGYSE